MEEFNAADILKEQERKKKLVFLEIGLFEISFVLIILLLFFGVLNYFNILSLSSLYPNQLGFLPHKAFNTQNKTVIRNTAQNLSQNPQLHLPPFEKLANQATDVQMSSYIALINAKKIPTDNPKYPEEIYGIFSGFDNNYIQIVTYNGIKNLSYTKDLTIQKYKQAEKSATSSAVTVGLTQIDKNSFFNQTTFGKTLHLSITLTSPETIQQIYLTE